MGRFQGVLYFLSNKQRISYKTLFWACSYAIHHEFSPILYQAVRWHAESFRLHLGTCHERLFPPNPGGVTIGSSRWPDVLAPLSRAAGPT